LNHADGVNFPPPFDQSAADRLRAAFPGAVDPVLAEVLACFGGNSPYLAELALREPDVLRAIMTQGPDAVCDLTLGRLAPIPPTLTRAETAALLRTAKRHIALTASVADIGGAWSLDQVTGALSDLAERALRIATAHLLRAAHEDGALLLPHPAAPDRGSGFTVLAMGKLGARELNFSSDVDLILIFDPDAHGPNADRLGTVFSRLARDLVALMQQRDAGGFVFRTDLRLRPDPGSTPPAISLGTALAYYEGTAQTWERAAMIKARPVAGDLALGRRFLDAIRPFVWRRHLDFAAIADIRAVKRRMDDHKDAALAPDGLPEARLLGHDLKLGQGGIREIEFCAQTLQLVWGGRNPALRKPATLPALQAAGLAGHLPAETVRVLCTAYDRLRQAEHRLQMVADRQTHSLPDTPAGFAAFATFLGAPSPAACAQDLLTWLRQVHAVFAGILAGPGEPPDLYRQETRTNPAALPAVADNKLWENWLSGRPRALRTERARALLSDLLPALAAVVQRQPQPEAVWARLDEFIHRLPSGVQVLSMLRHNPALLDRLGDVLGGAPWLADHLAGTPAALEGLVAPQDIDPDPSASLAAQLRDGRTLDEALGIASRFVRGEEFRLAVAELDGRIDQDAAGEARTALAEAAIGQLLPLVLADHARRYGRIPGGGLVVVALGKAGSHEMMAGSDLDLMLIYDHPETSTESTGSSRLAPSQYFARAAQAVVAALTVPTRDGKLYDVDMRLRPSGGKGPVAVSLAAFERYHRADAWTWERLALTRARVVAGPTRLRGRVTRAIGVALAQGDRDAVLPDTLAMRRRLEAELPDQGAWDAKLRPGGLMDVEFIAQALQLVHAREPGLLHPRTRLALSALGAAGVLSRAEADRLVQADRLWRAVQGLLRITGGRTVPAALPEATAARMRRVLDRLAPSASSSLEVRLDEVAADVRAAFRRHVGG
jgi:glutamate-ammonia-ligase adenylyltransferase